MKTTLDKIGNLSNQELYPKLLTSLGKEHSQREIDLVHKAYRLASEVFLPKIAHQKEKIPIYVKRSLFSAFLLAELNVDMPAVVAAFLSDLLNQESIEESVPEEKSRADKKPASDFGKPIKSILLNIYDVNKLELPLPWRIEYRRHERRREDKLDPAHIAIIELAKQEYVKKKAGLDAFKRFIQLFISSCKSLDVLIFKLVDRVATMCLLENLIEDENMRKLIAKESLRVHAFVAEAIGFWLTKWALEDESFRYLEPANYRKIAEKLKETREEREAYIEKVKNDLYTEFNKWNLQARIEGRPKHIYSIYKKMQKFHTDFEKIFDTLGIRVIVNSEEDCWKAWDIVKGLWPPELGIYENGKPYRDWITNRKLNEYQSIHTTVNTGEGKLLEVQIRTDRMDEVAKYGAVAHWRYKLEKKVSEPTEKREKEMTEKMAKLQKKVAEYLELQKA